MNPVFLLLATISFAYLEIPLKVQRDGSAVAYKMPLEINNIPYQLTISSQNQPQFLLNPISKVGQRKWKKIKKQHKALQGSIQASSLQGYTFEGWKRYFIQAFFFIEQKYYHKISLDLEDIPFKEEEGMLGDGLVTFGPNLTDNKIYSKLKQASTYISKDVISIYRGINDDYVHMQLGGYEENFAYGHRNGILFYEFPLVVESDKWKLPIKSLKYIRQKNGKSEEFFIPHAECNLAINFQSQYLVLPSSVKTQLERNFQSSEYSCKIFEDNRMGCYEIGTIDMALNQILLKIDDDVYINISLYDIRDSYDEKTKLTMFFLKFDDDNNKLQIGESLLRNYYISIDMKTNRIFYSPTNKFPSSFSSVYVIRFLVGFAIFTVVVAVGAMIYQMFNDPFRKNRITYGHEGIRLVPQYQRPGYNELD